MTMNLVDVPTYTFYFALMIVAGLGEYYHIVPGGTLVATMTLVTGHFFGNGATKAVLSNIASNVAIVTAATTTNAQQTASPPTPTTLPVSQVGP
jgi:hypothetical protein